MGLGGYPAAFNTLRVCKCRDKGLHKCGSNYPLPKQMNRGYEGQGHA